MDWQDTTPDYSGMVDPKTAVANSICSSICIFCYNFPRISFSIIAAITCFICFSLYYGVDDTPPTWSAFTDSNTVYDEKTYFEYGTFGYLNGNIWIYGNNYHPKYVYYINIENNNQYSFYIKQSDDIQTNYSFKNYLQSISDKQSNTIWSVDIAGQYLVSFNPYSIHSDHTKLYKIPDYYNGDKFFWAQCMTIDDNENMLYLLGGYNNKTYYIDYNTYGEILTFDLNTRKWHEYYTVDDIGYLQTINGYNIYRYGCSYNNKSIFVFGGGYGSSAIITHSIHYLNWNDIHIKWNKLENVTLNLSLLDTTTFTFGEDVYIFSGCNTQKRQCYVAQQTFNLQTLRITDHVIYESLELPYSHNFYVVNNYDESAVYIMYSDYNTKNLITYYFHDKIDAVYNSTYLIISVSCIIIVIIIGILYFKNRINDKDEENKPLSTN